MSKSIFDSFRGDFSGKSLFCKNCGEEGHLKKSCIKPVISYGICLFYYDTTIKKLYYLLVKRKDSISYIDFLRGKYAIDDKSYILKLLSRMTNNEKSKILKNNFDELWDELWMDSIFQINKRNSDDYNLAKDKLNLLKKMYNFENLLKLSKNNWEEAEWGLPKGRRNFKESNLNAAIREFLEETNIDRCGFFVYENHTPFIEEYIGSNNIKYRHVYYLARCMVIPKLEIDVTNYNQVTEIGGINLFDLESCMVKIRNYLSEKRDILQTIDTYIHKYSLHIKNLDNPKDTTINYTNYKYSKSI